ncbi:sensor histidine kinase [Streptomyces fructofermentans]|uniref:sensor histidine kinase n=1 Tax=Streptomyces fructofermentans TaxID=152141 RepID=UPI001672D58E
MTAPIPPARPATDRPSLAPSRGDRPGLRAVAPAVIATAVPAALAVVATVALADGTARAPLAWGLGAAALLLCAAVAAASRATVTARLLRRRLDSVTNDTGRLLQERARLTGETSRERTRLTDEFAAERTRLTEEFAAERARLTEEFAVERTLLTDGFAAERTLLDERNTRDTARLTTELAQERARLGTQNARQAAELRRARSDRAAAVSAAANAAGRMQALATGMLADLRAMEDKHSDEEVLADLLHLDHRTAQAGRLADSVAVLAGARSGRRWARPIVMESILRGAMGRIAGYQRVRVHSASEAAVAGHAAEGVMHALAEILDNAANFSPPTAEVHVYVEEVPAGVIVSVEDSGLVMGEVQLRRAESAVSGEGADLGGLSGTRLGLAVVGRLARKYGLRVSFRPSARGGTGVLVLVPQDILSDSSGAETPVAPEPPALPAPEPRETHSATRALPDPEPEPVRAHEFASHDDESAGNLPKRSRGRTLAEAERGRSRTAAAPEARSDADDKYRGARFGSFRQAVRRTPSDGAGDDTPPGDAPRERAHTGSAQDSGPEPSPHATSHLEGDPTS